MEAVDLLESVGEPIGRQFVGAEPPRFIVWLFHGALLLVVLDLLSTVILSRPSSAQRIGEPAASTLTPSRR